MPISATDTFTPAFEHTKQQLLHPFRLGQWVRLAFVGFLAGELSSGGGCNFHSSVPSNGPMPSMPQMPHTMAAIAIIIAALAVIGVVLWIVFLYLNSRMRFVLFDSILLRECRIRQGWARHKQHGWNFFLWQLSLAFISLASFVILIGVPVLTAWGHGWFKNPGNNVWQLVLGGIVVFFLVVAVLIVFAVIAVFTKDFIVPQMALEDIGVLDGWRRLWPQIKADKGGYAAYIGMKIVLNIGAGIIFGIVTMIIVVALLLPMVAGGVLAVLGGHVAGLVWNATTIALAVIAGGVAIAFLTFVGAMISVPTVVFFPAFSIYFYAERYPPLAAVLWPPQPTAFAPVVPSMEPPPPAPIG